MTASLAIRLLRLQAPSLADTLHPPEIPVNPQAGHPDIMSPVSRFPFGIRDDLDIR